MYIYSIVNIIYEKVHNSYNQVYLFQLYSYNEERYIV